MCSLFKRMKPVPEAISDRAPFLKEKPRVKKRKFPHLCSPFICFLVVTSTEKGPVISFFASGGAMAYSK